MANPILPKHNNTAGVIPAAAALQINELAINTADGVAYVKHSDGTVKQIVDPTKMPLSQASSFATAAQGAKADAALPSTNYTAADVLNKIKTVDGIGSGLDADLLRGLPADFTASLTPNGYQKLPSGLILQWGRSTTTIPVASSVQFNFNIPFSVDVVYTSAVAVTANPDNGLLDIQCVANTISTFHVINKDGDSAITQIRWFAIGY